MANNGKRSTSGANQRIDINKPRKKKKLKPSDYYIIAIGLIIALIIVVGVINENAPRNYYLKDIKILECSVTRSEIDSNKFYLKVSPDLADNLSISEDNSWIEVNNDFFMKHMMTNSKIGVKFNNTDIYKKKYWGLFSDKGQIYEKNVWAVEEVYDTIADAEEANPVKQFAKQATIEKKKITQLGDHFFVINSDQRSMPIMVEEEIYNKYNVNDSINCEFESIGDLTKFVKISQ